MFSNEDDGDACSGLLGRVGYRHNSSRVLSRRIDYGCEEGPRRTKITVENRTGKVIEGRYEVEKCCGMVLIRYRVRHAELKKFDSRYICAGWLLCSMKAKDEERNQKRMRHNWNRQGVLSQLRSKKKKRSKDKPYSRAMLYISYCLLTDVRKLGTPLSNLRKVKSDGIYDENQTAKEDKKPTQTQSEHSSAYHYH